MCVEKHTILFISRGFVSPPCRQSVLCPWMGHWEVIWFINDGVRFALLHPKAVCSSWLPPNGAQPWSYKLKPGKFLEQSPSAVSPKYRSFFIRVIIRALVWKEAIAWDDRNGNTDFIVVVIMRSRGKFRNKLMQNKLYCKCWSNQTCSKLPAWLSEQPVKGWNWCLSWAAMLLWPQHALLETQKTHRFLLRKLDAVIPWSTLPGHVSWYFGFKWLVFWKECLDPPDLKSPTSPHKAPYLSRTLYGPSARNPAPLLPRAAVKDKVISLSWRHDL